MMTGPENWRVAYPAFLGAMVLIGGVVWLALRGWGRDRAPAGRKQPAVFRPRKGGSGL